jgi:hypothetical protein
VKHRLLGVARTALGPETEARLFDSQWVNVVNHDNCYRGWTKEDAVHHAVRMTEQYMRENIEKGWPKARITTPPAATSQAEPQA